jgi:tetratricopeptide (TPR) repeat protein
VLLLKNKFDHSPGFYDKSKSHLAAIWYTFTDSHQHSFKSYSNQLIRSILAKRNNAPSNFYFDDWSMPISEKSVRYLKLALDKSPNNTEARLELAQILKFLHRPDDALKELAAVIQIDPDEALAYYRRSQIYESQNKLPAAISDLTSSLELGDDADIHAKRGRLLMQVGDYAGAIPDFDWCIRVGAKPGSDAFAEVVPSYYQLRADCERKLGFTEKALQDYEAALREDPELTGSMKGIEECKAALSK